MPTLDFKGKSFNYAHPRSVPFREPIVDAETRTRNWRWQSDCWDTQLRSGKHYHEKWLYVRENPVRSGLVENAEQWDIQGELNVLRW